MCKPQDGRRDKNPNSTCGSRYFDHYSELCVGLSQTWASIVWMVQHRLDGVCRKWVICPYLNGAQHFDHYSGLCVGSTQTQSSIVWTVQHRLDGPASFGRCLQEVSYLSLSKRRTTLWPLLRAVCGINPDTVQHRLDGPASFGRSSIVWTVFAGSELSVPI